MYLHHASTSVFVLSVETNAYIFVCLQMFSSHRSGLVWIQEQQGAQHDGLLAGWPRAVKASTITKDRIKSVRFICICIRLFELGVYIWQCFLFPFVILFVQCIFVLLFVWCIFGFLLVQCTRSITSGEQSRAVGAFSYFDDSQTFLKFIVDASI